MPRLATLKEAADMADAINAIRDKARELDICFEVFAAVPIEDGTRMAGGVFLNKYQFEAVESFRFQRSLENGLVSIEELFKASKN